MAAILRCVLLQFFRSYTIVFPIEKQHFPACYDNGLSVRFMFKYLPFHLFPVCQQGKTETFRKGETFPAGNGQPNKPFQCVAVKENTVIGHTGVR